MSSLQAVFFLSLITPSLSYPTHGWFQDPNSPSAKLFARSDVSGVNAVTPGSSAWAALYPASGSTPPDSAIPPSWLARLAEVTSTSDFPKFGPSALNSGYPLYTLNGATLTGTDPSVCSFTYQCVDVDDVYNAPDGVIGLSFDDGPLAPSSTLYPFLKTNNISATHFMIGGNVLQGPDLFANAIAEGGHVAVHTWSHPYMTTLTNNQIVAELGFTIDIIASLNGGRVPGFWRPPYGDVDNRVRAIASGVFGLRTVVWNQDSADWAIGSNPAYTHDNVVSTVTGWLTGPKSPGLVMLEHELSDDSVSVFLSVYPIMISNGWNVKNVADAMSDAWYQNSASDTASVINQTTVATGALLPNGTLSKSNTSTTSVASSSSSSSSASPSSSGSSTLTGSLTGSATASVATTSVSSSVGKSLDLMSWAAAIGIGGIVAALV